MMRIILRNITLSAIAVIIVGCASSNGNVEKASNVNAAGGSEREIYGSIRMGGSYNL